MDEPDIVSTERVNASQLMPMYTVEAIRIHCIQLLTLYCFLKPTSCNNSTRNLSAKHYAVMFPLFSPCVNFTVIAEGAEKVTNS